MAEIKRYLYNSMSFKIATGYKPVVVNTEVINSKLAIPQVIWNIDFGKIDLAFKNAIEETIFLEPNNTTILSYIGPHFYIGKRTDVTSGLAEYYLTYVFEYVYYSTFVNKPLSYVVDGTDHLIEDTLRIPISQAEGDTPVSFTGAIPLPRKIFYLDSSLDFRHESNNIFNFKVKFNEIAAPLSYTNLFIAGKSDADNNLYC